MLVRSPIANVLLHDLWRALVEKLESNGLEAARRGAELARRLIIESGVTYNIYADPQGRDRPWGLDTLPLILPAGEWRTIEAGIVQRARLLDALLDDLYGYQVLPGGLARIASDLQADIVSHRRGGSSKDVWILPEASAALDTAKTSLLPRQRTRGADLPSRMGESDKLSKRHASSSWKCANPTNGVRAGLGYIALAWGRDFGDVSPLRGVIVGGGQHQLAVSVAVEPLPASAA